MPRILFKGKIDYGKIRQSTRRSARGKTSHPLLFQPITMPEISKANKTCVHELAEQLDKYDRLIAKHLAIIRTDPDFAEVLTTDSQEKTTLSANFMPEDRAERNQFEKQMEECIRTLENSDDFSDHFRVVGAAFFICRKVLRDATDMGRPVLLETLHANTALRYAHPFPREVVVESLLYELVSSGLSRALVSTTTPSHAATSNPSHTEDVPKHVTLENPAGNSSSWNQVDQARLIPIPPQQLQQWMEKPETLPLHQVFVGGVNGNEKAYRVVAVTTMESQKIIHVQFVDDGKAVVYSMNNFFDFLIQARTVEMN
ncbi:hypothetical protein FB446DRAFT_716755 [Lentinula raphanica]|nr:hypothetical protein FB446DRAFT_716755 [Lentinula raphanica]